MINEIIKLGEVYENADLKKYTTYKVGGKADYLVLPYVVVCLNILDDYPGMDWLYDYNIMNHSKLYITCCFYFYLSFIMGSLFPLLFYRKSFIYRNNYCTIINI